MRSFMIRSLSYVSACALLAANLTYTMETVSTATTAAVETTSVIAAATPVVPASTNSTLANLFEPVKKAGVYVKDAAINVGDAVRKGGVELAQKAGTLKNDTTTFITSNYEKNPTKTIIVGVAATAVVGFALYSIGKLWKSSSSSSKKRERHAYA